jgi:group I intron endonuclease
MSTFIIYKTINLINGKFYIGQHNTSADDGYLGSGTRLRNSLKKHGKENFIRKTLEYCTSADVNEKEIYWIKELSATNFEIGYNISEGGSGGNWTEERRKKSSLKIMGKNNPNYGNKWSDEQKEKARKMKIGKKQSKETVEKRAVKNRTKKRSPEWIKNNIERFKTLKQQNPDIFSSGKNKIWMTDGKKNFRIEKCDLEKYIEMGYRRGKSTKIVDVFKNKIWVTNIEKNLRIEKCDLEKYIEMGYKKGITFKK